MLGINIKNLKKKINKSFSAHKKRYLFMGIVLLIILVFIGGLLLGYFYLNKDKQKPLITEQQKDIYEEFLSEVYSKIQENYWDKVSDEQLSNLFKLAAEKIISKPQNLKSENKEGVLKMFTEISKDMDKNRKKEFITTLSHMVLVNLKPLGRNALYTRKEQKDLTNRVQNINPETNLYSNLGAKEDASLEELKKAYENKVAELEPKREQSQEAKEELEKVKYAYEVLSNEENKKRYDQIRVEPTVFGKLVRSDILYLYIKKMSPTTLNDLKIETEKFDEKEELNALILDLRGNIGGSFDLLQYLLGPFIGPNQYAFELFQQGNYEPFKTKFGWLPSLVRYKKVIILVDENTQSSAEVMVAILKKYNVGIVIGNKTKGWGTIEKVYEIENQIDEEEKYSIFLVNHLTLRDDGQPVEENGVDPTININDPNWEKQLFAYFNYNELIKAVKEIWNKKPGEL